MSLCNVAVGFDDCGSHCATWRPCMHECGAVRTYQPTCISRRVSKNTFTLGGDGSKVIPLAVRIWFQRECLLAKTSIALPFVSRRLSVDAICPCSATMHKSKGRFRKFLRGLKGGNLEPGQLSQNAKIAEPPPSIAKDDSSVNNSSLTGKKDENPVKNATWTEVRTSKGAEEYESPPLAYEIEALDERDISREIWIEAYTGLQNGDGTKDLVNIYEVVLSQQLKGMRFK